MSKQESAGLSRAIGKVSVDRGRRSDDDLGQSARVVGVELLSIITSGSGPIGRH
jgi:hypothetical protein